MVLFASLTAALPLCMLICLLNI